MRHQCRQNRRLIRRSRRRGSLYVSVMIVSLIVALIGMSSLHVARLSLTTSQASDDRIIAEQIARSAVEFAVNRINSDSSWRSSYTNGAETPYGGHTIGAGSFTFKLVEPDGDLADDNADGVWLSGIGRAGDATFVETVLLQPTGQPLSCLEASFHCNTDIATGSDVILVTDQFLSSNGSISATALNSSIDGDAEAVGTITGSVNGSQTAGIPPRRMPGDAVFEYYLANGTWIDAASLPTGPSGDPTIENCVISPSINPYGPETNAEGIYVVDCGSQQVDIQNCRVLGTLVFVNASPTVLVGGAIHVKPAVPNYPVLMVQGEVTYTATTSVLDEAVLGVNFNPPRAAYKGTEDADTSDVYPSRVEGLTYVSGLLRLAPDGQRSRFVGIVVAGGVDANSDAEFEYRATSSNYPPPGFVFGNPMRIAPGTWRRTSLP